MKTTTTLLGNPMAQKYILCEYVEMPPEGSRGVKLLRIADGFFNEDDAMRAALEDRKSGARRIVMLTELVASGG